MATRIMDKDSFLASPDLAALLSRPSVVVAALEDKSFSATAALTAEPVAPEYSTEQLPARALPYSSAVLELVKGVGHLLSEFYIWLSGPPLTQQARNLLSIRATQIYLRHWDL